MLTKFSRAIIESLHNGLSGILTFFYYLKFRISKMDIKRMSKNDFPRIELKKKAKRDLLRRMKLCEKMVNIVLYECNENFIYKYICGSYSLFVFIVLVLL
jgi:hypothetical protein